jgi:hypothetical protein
MIPLRDNIPSRTTPVVNYAMIGICSLMFLAQLLEPGKGEVLIEKFGMIPVRVFHPDQPVTVREVEVDGTEIREVGERTFAAPPFSPWLTLLTCIFLHGGWLHFLGNMWFLHIFGDNVEDRLGHVGYLIFYVFCGVFASLTHLFTNVTSDVPTIGASGAIAGVMGAYLLLYPNSKVLTLIPIVYFITTAVLPAPLFLIIWFGLQFLQGLMTITDVKAEGVAWFAHIGGFAAGFLIALIMNAAGATRPKVEERLPGTDHVTYRRRAW